VNGKSNKEMCLLIALNYVWLDPLGYYISFRYVGNLGKSSSTAAKEKYAIDSRCKCGSFNPFPVVTLGRGSINLRPAKPEAYPL